MASETFRTALYAPCTGRFQSRHRIGDFVVAGQPIAAVGTAIITAPATGVLSGLAARGSRPETGTRVGEVDTRGEPAECFGVPDWCECVAAEVAERLFAPTEISAGELASEDVGPPREIVPDVDLPIWAA